MTLTPRIDQVARAVEAVTGYTFDDICCTDRHSKISDARSVFVNLLFMELKMGVVDIGKLLGRSHSSILYYIKRDSELKSIGDVSYVYLYNTAKSRYDDIVDFEGEKL